MNTMLATILLLGGLVLVSCAGHGPRTVDEPAPRTGLSFETIEIDGQRHGYAVYVPRAYSNVKTWPCVVFLNGSGECGTDGQRQLTQGLFPAMVNSAEDWPMVAVFPQKPTRASAWADHDDMVMAMLAATRVRLSIDPSRIYLTGLSQGGAGTWSIGARHPEVFAAIAPVCGYGEPTIVAPGLASMPIWAFHGERDDVVKPAQTRNIIEAVERTSGRVAEVNPPGGASLKPGDKSPLRVTYFPDLNHGCWDRTYRDMELGEWLLSWRKD